MLSKTKIDERLALYKNLFLLFCLFYGLSFAIPATSSPTLNDTKILYGWEAAFWATLSMSDSVSLFIGGLANFIILLILALKKITPLRKKITTSLVPSLLLTIVIISAGIWLYLWNKPLFLGYYIWALSVIGLCTIYLLQQRLEQHSHQVQKQRNIMDHLVEKL